MVCVLVGCGFGRMWVLIKCVGLDMVYVLTCVDSYLSIVIC